HQIAQPTWKLGVRFLWGPRPYFDYALNRQFTYTFPGLPKGPGYYCDDVLDFGFLSLLMTHDRIFPRRQDGLPHITRDPAYHIENEPFGTFLEQSARRVGVEVADDTVVQVKQDDTGVAGLVLASGPPAPADLYVDCSGFRSVLLGQTLGEPFRSFKSS